MSGLGRRVPTAIGYSAVVLVPVLFGPAFFAVVVGLLGAIAYAELVSLYRERSAGPSIVGLILVVALIAPRLFVGRDWLVDAVVLALGVVGAILTLGSARRAPPLARFGSTVAAAVYLSWLLGYLADLDRAGSFHTFHGVPESFPSWLLLALVPTWAADIASYTVGSLIGRRKLAPKLSPGKTWEGTVAGIAAAALFAIGVGAFAGMPRVSVALVAIALGPVALAGDLFGSFLKRQVGAKDSGSLLPGHGGVLDRIDSLIAVAPLVTIALFLAGTLG